ncbi:hypothetical protein QBC35DRAFT_344598, partial [Podospora australis]
ESFRNAYPRLAAFLNSDREFPVFRRFGQVHVRLLLHMQDEIVELEDRLNELDASELNDYSLRTRREDRNQDRKAVLAELESRLLSYDKLLDMYLRQMQWPAAKENSIQSNINRIRDNKPLVFKKSRFLNHWDDLVGPSPSSAQPVLDSWIANCA